MNYEKIMLATAVLIFFASASLAELEMPNAYASTEISMQINWTLLITGNTQPYSIEFTGLVPLNYSGQEVSKASATRKFTIDENTGLANFTFKIPKTETITYDGTVKIDYSDSSFSETVQYPMQETSESKDYLKESPLVEITPEIKQKALEITGNSNDAIEASARLVEWVHNNVEYDIKYGSANYSSTWVYENRKGTCDEYAHLLMAMARSAGIPARYASGYVLGVSPSPEYGPVGSLQWVPHGWVELYFPQQGWTPADPTYNEFIQLDASHLKLSNALDQSFLKETLQGRGEPGVTLGLGKKYSIKITSFKEFDPPKISIDFPQEANDSIQKIIVSLQNPTEKILIAPIEVVLPGGLQTKTQKKQLVYLKPREEKQVALDAKITFEMQNNTRYTFPIQVYAMGKQVQTNFTRTTLSEAPANVNITEINPQGIQNAISEIPLDFKLLIGITLLTTLALVILAIIKASR